MRRLSELTVGVYLALMGFGALALPGQPLVKRPVVRVEVKILAGDYRICLKKILSHVEASISQKLARDAQEVPALRFVTWSAAAASNAPVLSVYLDEAKAGFGKNIFLRFNFNAQRFPLGFQIPVYKSYEEQSPGNRDRLEAKIKELWMEQLNRGDFQQQIREFLKTVPIAREVSIPRSNLVIVPLLKDDLQPREGSELGVLFMPLESHGEDAELKLRTLARSPHEWSSSIASTVSTFEFPTGSRSTGWSEGIWPVFRRKDEKSVRVFMLDYRWEYDGTADRLQRSPD